MLNKIYYNFFDEDSQSSLSKYYDFFMMIVITISILPLAIHTENAVTKTIDSVTVVVFIIDYVLRFCTANYKLNKGPKSFLIYPFTFMALIDLISILPNISLLQRGFRLLKIARLVRTFKVFRLFKTFRYSKNITRILNVFKKQKDNLLVVCGFAIGYIIVCAFLIFNVEPDTFPTIYDAIYWATISLTTVGYGDVYCSTAIGKFITMVSAIVGIAIIALPSGIIISGYSEELNNEREEKESNG